MPDMMFWLVVLVLGCVVLVGQYNLESKKLEARKRRDVEDDSIKEIVRRLQKIEQRMANIETIVLDREKHDEFERRL